MKDARVYRGTQSQQFVIKVRETPRNVEFISSVKDICVASLRKEEFEASFTLSNHDPAKAAQTFLGGTKKIDEKARAMLEAISHTEYEMPNEATQAAPAATPAVKTPKTPKAPKEPKAAAAPKLDDEGKPIPAAAPKTRKVTPKPAKVAYTMEQKLTFVAANPKKPSSAAHGRFAKYEVDKTFTELVAAGLTRPDFAYDLAHGFIKA
jgi:hypothetical protein